MAIEAWTGTYEELPLGAEEYASQLIDGAAIDAFAHAIQALIQSIWMAIGPVRIRIILIVSPTV